MALVSPCSETGDERDETYKYPITARTPAMVLVAATPMVSTEGMNNTDTGASISDRRALV